MNHICRLYFLLLVFLSSQANAASIEIVEDNGNSVSDYSGPSAIGFEVEWVNTKPVKVRIHLDMEQTISSITCNISSRNYSMINWEGFHVKLGGGATWQAVYKTIPWDGRSFRTKNLANYTSEINRHENSKSIDIMFDPPIPYPGGLVLGMGGRREGSDWSIDINKITSGDSFTILLWPTPSKHY